MVAGGTFACTVDRVHKCYTVVISALQSTLILFYCLLGKSVHTVCIDLPHNQLDNPW